MRGGSGSLGGGGGGGGGGVFLAVPINYNYIIQ